MSAQQANQRELAIGILAGQSARTGEHRTKIVELLSKCRDVNVDDVEALILVAKVKTKVQGKPGFKIVGGVAGNRPQLQAMEILLSEKIQEEDDGSNSN